MGETREERLREYLEENAAPGARPARGRLAAAGRARRCASGARNGARLFRRDAPPEELAPGAALDHLLLGGPSALT